MTQPPADHPGQTLQLLNFQPVLAPPDLAVYQARVKDQAAPDTREYVVTATTSRPRTDAERADLEDVLSTIRASFTLLTGPIPVDPGDILADPGDILADPGDILADAGDIAPQLFDPGSQIEFQVGIESAFPVPGPVSIAATLQATTGVEAIEQRDTVNPNKKFRDIVNPHKRDHVWQSSGGPQRATVHVDSGSGTISPPYQTVVAGGGDKHHHYYAFGTQVTVHGDVRMVYDLDGNFIPP